MKYFIVEGILKNVDKINDSIMKEHMDYTKKTMDEGLILMSGLKEDMGGGMFVIKLESLQMVQEYLSNEPFNINGIQEYKIIEFNPHYFNESPKAWFNK